jgi:hypothetical protein
MDDPLYYKVTMKAMFVDHNEVFRPGVTYRVTKAIYDGAVSGAGPYEGKIFSTLCATAEPVYPRQ